MYSIAMCSYARLLLLSYTIYVTTGRSLYCEVVLFNKKNHLLNLLFPNIKGLNGLILRNEFQMIVILFGVKRSQVLTVDIHTGTKRPA